MTFKKERKGPTPEQLELARILSLPVIKMMTPEELEMFSFENLRAEAYDRGDRFRLEQGSAMRAYTEAAGGFFPLSVGKGKSAVSIFGVNHSYRHGVRKSMLLLEPQNVRGFMKHHVPQWRRMLDLAVPFHFMGGRDAKTRRRMAESDAPGCYVVPYSLVSRPDFVDDVEGNPGNLSLIAPELIISDEVHNLSNPRVARTKRITNYLRGPGAQFIGMSGTITQKSLMDYWHLISAALGDKSPLPRTAGMTQEWDAMLNADAEEPNSHGMKVMAPLLSWARGHADDEKFDPDSTESYRRAFRHRLVSAPGVVSSHEDDVGASLRFVNTEIDDAPKREGFQALETLIKDVNKDTTPQGEVIAHAFHRFKWHHELAAGFFNELRWPTVDDLLRNRHIPEETAAGALEGAKLLHAAQQALSRESRRFFRNSPPGLDTPRQLGLACSRHDRRVPREVQDGWDLQHQLKERCEAKFGFIPERKSRPIRVCDFRVNHAVRWAEQNDYGIIWVHSKELGIWITEALREAGADPLYCPAGAKHNEAIEAVGNPELGGKGDRLVVARWKAHGTGKNLQAFSKMHFAQFPRSAKLAEQVIGREHRFGQKADVVLADTGLTLEHDHLVRAAAINDAIYVQQTTGAPQRLVFGDYDPLPKMYSAEFLREQGIEDVKNLSHEGAHIRDENFGSLAS